MAGIVAIGLLFAGILTLGMVPVLYSVLYGIKATRIGGLAGAWGPRCAAQWEIGADFDLMGSRDQGVARIFDIYTAIGTTTPRLTT